MDLTFSPEQEAFRAELRAWFEENRPTERFDPVYTPAGLKQHLEWERKLSDKGYSAPGWPVDAGGLGLDTWSQVVYDEEYNRLGLPERVNKMGLLHGGPTVLEHGTDEQRRAWLPGILNCDQIWCQGFSEPDAGSDLAALRTTGEIVGDEIIINGQKTWTSNGTLASRMFAIIRTDTTVPKHKGISFVVFDLDVPGVEIRPMAQLHGNAGFAEVFFTDVRIPLANVVGKLNDGWNVAATSLILERGTGRGNHTKIMHSLDGLIATVAERRPDDTAALERLGSLRAWAFAYEQATYASIDGVVRGAPDNGGSSVIKLRWSEIQTAIYEEQLATFGDEAEVVSESGPNGEFVGWQRNYWHSRAGEIYAGTNEVQRNIIAERMLGLPREVRP